MKIILPEQAHQKILDSHGKIFGVVFRRKNDKIERDSITGERRVIARAGDLREMNCRTKVKSKLHTPDGEGKKYIFSQHNLVSVYDLKKQAYRSFKWENVIFLKMNGEKYIVLSPQTLEYCKKEPESELAKNIKDSGIEI